MYKLLSLFCLLNLSIGFASPGDTLHVFPFQKLKIFTDPSKGFKQFSNWGTFPSSSISYRKVLLNVTFQCPDSLHCGEWDYAGNISIKRTGNEKSTLKDYEIARMMTPYGWSFDSKWKFTWQTDVTDFGSFLHDSVEIAYTHNGYENATDRGWLVTFDFQLIEGTPIQPYLGFEKLWNGNFKYGDSLYSIENHLSPIQLKNNLHAPYGRLRILQSGHGMDSKENCAEFCPKLRSIYFDSTLIDQRKIWKKCGTNALYPQAGTWIYDRANWCPGSLVPTENFTITLQNHDVFSLNIDMEEYKNIRDNPAHYSFSSFLFYLGNPISKNDACIERIFQPSTEDELIRINPIATRPSVLIKNNGSKPLRKLTLLYGIKGQKQKKYTWKGSLKFGDTSTISLPDFNVTNHISNGVFSIQILKTNSKKDEYIYDNIATSIFEAPKKLPTHFIIELQSNDSSKYLAYQLKDNNDRIIKERKLGTIAPHTLYRDTFQLKEGNYTFTFIDTLNVGLDFWAMPEAGYGHLRIFDLKGNLIQNYKSDFGSFEFLEFTATKDSLDFKVNEEFPIITIFPRSNDGHFHVDYLGDSKETILIQVEDQTTKSIVYETSFENLQAGFIPFDLSNLKENRYTMIFNIKGKSIRKNFRIRRS